MSSSTQPLSETFVQSEEDKLVAEFMSKQATTEQERLKHNGVDVQILKVKNLAIIRDESTPTEQPQTNSKNKNKKPTRKVINRIEVNTELDFDTIPQLLLSPAVKCTPKPSLNYVNIILLGSNNEAYLCPYTFPSADKDNNLQHWALINNDMKRTDLSIDTFQNV